MTGMLLAAAVIFSACNPLSDSQTGSLLGTDFQPGIASSSASPSSTPSPTIADTNPNLNASWTPKFSNLVGYWNLNEASGAINFINSAASASASTSLVCSYTVEPASGYPCPVAGVTGKVNQAAQFTSGAALSAQTNSLYSFDTADSFTLSAWIKTTASGSSYNALEIINKVSPAASYRGYELSLDTNGYAYFGLNFDGYAMQAIFVKSPIVSNDGAWHHVVGVYSGSGTIAGVHLYVDGIERSGPFLNSLPPMPASITTSAYMTIGNRPSQGNVNFEGLIDEPAIWNTSLTQSEVQTIYNRQVVAH